jgi:predicted amidohydrolase
MVFPELSLTGYEPELAAGLTMTAEDGRLAPLKELSRAHGIIIVAGAPIASQSQKPYIGACVLAPDSSAVYLKHHLHEGEDEFFLPGCGNRTIGVIGVTIGLAICADLAEPSHAAQAAQDGASVYAASVLCVEARNGSPDGKLLCSHRTFRSGRAECFLG